MSEFEKDLANVMGSFMEINLDCVEKQNQEIEKLQNNWNELKEYCLNEQIPEEYDEYNSYIEFSNSVFETVLNKMQELEGNNE
jgi:hypothetical protein